MKVSVSDELKQVEKHLMSPRSSGVIQISCRSTEVDVMNSIEKEVVIVHSEPYDSAEFIG
jgi:hypothetical protein